MYGKADRLNAYPSAKTFAKIERIYSEELFILNVKCFSSLLFLL